MEASSSSQKLCCILGRQKLSASFAEVSTEAGNGVQASLPFNLFNNGFRSGRENGPCNLISCNPCLCTKQGPALE